MKRRFKLLSFLIFGCLAGIAQKPGEMLNRWAEQSPVEKTYLHMDRDNYIAGETVWFKAYLYSDFYPDTISTTLYVELVNESSQILDRKIIPVFLGSCTGAVGNTRFSYQWLLYYQGLYSYHA